MRKTIFIISFFILSQGYGQDFIPLRSILPNMPKKSGSYGYSPAGVENFSRFFKYKNVYFFNGGGELWTTDFTNKNTKLFKDLNPNGNSNPYYFLECNGKLFFLANRSNNVNGNYINEIWVTDGTIEGTKFLKSISLNESYPFTYFQCMKDKVYFVGKENNGSSINGRLWVTDGTPTGTQAITDSSLGVHFVYASKSRLFMRANWDLYISDGTKTGTYNQRLGINHTQYEPIGFSMINDSVVLFKAKSEDYLNSDDAIYIADNNGIRLLKVLSTGNFTSIDISRFYNKVVENKLYFMADINDEKNELHISDGTVDGTKLIKVLVPGGTKQSLFGGAKPDKFYGFDGKVYFVALDELDKGNRELWVTDNTTIGTKRISNFKNYTTAAKEPNLFRVYKNKLYFESMDSSDKRFLYYIDNSTTHEIKKGCSKRSIDWSGSSTSTRLEVVDNKLLYYADLTELVDFDEDWYVLSDFPLPDTTALDTTIKDTTHNNAVNIVQNYHIDIYPNPSTSIIHIDISQYPRVQNCVWTLVDDLGREVLNQRIDHKETKINTAQLPVGIYHSSISMDGKVVDRRKLTLIR